MLDAGQEWTYQTILLERSKTGARATSSTRACGRPWKKTTRSKRTMRTRLRLSLSVRPHLAPPPPLLSLSSCSSICLSSHTAPISPPSDGPKAERFLTNNCHMNLACLTFFASACGRLPTVLLQWLALNPKPKSPDPDPFDPKPLPISLLCVTRKLFTLLIGNVLERPLCSPPDMIWSPASCSSPSFPCKDLALNKIQTWVATAKAAQGGGGGRGQGRRRGAGVESTNERGGGGAGGTAAQGIKHTGGACQVLTPIAPHRLQELSTEYLESLQPPEGDGGGNDHGTFTQGGGGVGGGGDSRGGNSMPEAEEGLSRGLRARKK